MGADKARRSFDPARMYRSVVAQQGRVTVEADANEAEEIRAAEARAELLELVGPTGTPDDGFQIVPGGGGPFDVGIAAGTLYVGGLRVAQRSPTTYLRQRLAEWCDFPAGAPAADPGADTPLPYDELVFLELTEHEVSAVEDRVLREVALGGPDTSARMRLVQRVMRAPLGGDAGASESCDESLARVLEGSAGVGLDPDSMRVTTTGALKVDFDPAAAAAADPCEPIAQGGFLGAENQLIRVQVAADGSLLWGYDNASFVYRGVVTPDQQSIKLLGTPVDVFHQPRPGQWVEVLDVAVDLGDGERLAASCGQPYALLGYDATTNTLQLPSAVTQSLDADVFVRVWENQLAFSGDGATATELVLADLSGTGVVVYTSGAAVPGDYWMVGVRPSNPTAILPARLRTAFQPPDGPGRWAAALAKVHWTDPAGASVKDCRRRFDDLVTLTHAAACELMLRPGDDLQRLIDRRIDAHTAAGIDGMHVHFADGRFDLTAPLVLKAAVGGHLTITGCGRATELVVAGWEAAIIASGWRTTTVSDLSVAAPGRAADQQTQQLAGALTILDTGVALVERVAARCASGSTRTASCLTIRNNNPATGLAAEVRSCDLAPGANQIGALLVNTAVATVEGNRISPPRGAPPPVVTTRRTLVSNVRLGSQWTTDPAAHAGRVDLSFPLWGEQVLTFRTEESLRDIWAKVLEAHKQALGTEGRPDADADRITTADRRRIRDFLALAVTQILSTGAPGPLKPADVPDFRHALDLRRKTPPKVAVAAGQGIVIGGAVATDVRIMHNTITGARRGIHVGLSRKDAGRDEHIRVERLQIVGNTIRHRVPADWTASQAGIFVGNVDLATIRDNRIVCEVNPRDDAPQPTIRAEGIRVWGVLGDDAGHFLLISGNITENASTGIRLVRQGAAGTAALVQITQNLAIATQVAVQSNIMYDVDVANRP